MVTLPPVPPLARKIRWSGVELSIQIPDEIARICGIGARDVVSISVEDDMIVLEPLTRSGRSRKR